MSIHYIHNFYNMLQFLTMCYKMFKQENRAPRSPWLQGAGQAWAGLLAAPGVLPAVLPSQILPSCASWAVSVPR